MEAAATSACAKDGATRPTHWPACSAHSPIAHTAGSAVRMASSTSTPRLTGRPAARASSACGPDADRHHHDARRDPRAVGQHHRIRLDRDGRACVINGDALSEQPALQHRGRAKVQLAFHQPVRAVQHGHPHAAPGQPGRRFQAQQPAADHHRVTAGGGVRDHLLHVVQRAVRQHVGSIGAGQRQAHRLRAGGQHQGVVRDTLARLQHDLAVRTVEGGNPRVGAPGNAVGVHPLRMVGDEVVKMDVAGEELAERHPVVRMRRFRPDQGHGRAARCQPFGASRAGRTGTDHDHPGIAVMCHAAVIATHRVAQSQIGLIKSSAPGSTACFFGRQGWGCLLYKQ